MRLPALAISLLLLIPTAEATSPAAEATTTVQQQQLDAVRRYRRGIDNILSWMDSRPDLFPDQAATQDHLPVATDKQLVRDLWSRMLDYYLALDTLARQHEHFYLERDETRRRHGLLIRFGAWLAGYRGALEFLARVDNSPHWDTVLNESVPSLGIGRNSFQDFKYRYLHLAAGTEFVTLYSLYRLSFRDDDHDLATELRQDAQRVLEFGMGKGELMTLQNALTLLKQKHNEAWLPVQAGIAEWMGDTKILRPHAFLIKPEQIRELGGLLQPGDIMLQRREWYLSNAGLPGFWPHAALYVGTADERRRHFNTPRLDTWLNRHGIHGKHRGDAFNALLQRDFPDTWQRSQELDADGKVYRIIEAISEGVSFTSLEHSAAADSLVILRPRLSAAARARAIYRAWLHQGKPYDYNFDFVTDNELVCSELVYKAYEPGDGLDGLQLPLVTVLGRTVSTPNDMARLFDQEQDTDQAQLEMIQFLDGDERSGTARKADLKAFRDSWKRPKWHILLPSKDDQGSE